MGDSYSAWVWNVSKAVDTLLVVQVETNDLRGSCFRHIVSQIPCCDFGQMDESERIVMVWGFFFVPVWHIAVKEGLCVVPLLLPFQKVITLNRLWPADTGYQKCPCGK